MHPKIYKNEGDDDELFVWSENRVIRCIQKGTYLTLLTGAVIKSLVIIAFYTIKDTVVEQEVAPKNKREN